MHYPNPTEDREGMSAGATEAALEKFGHLVPKTLAALNLPPHADFDDLMSVGRMALIQAAAHIHSDATAESYLRLRVRGAMLDYIRGVTWVPRHTLARKRQLEQAVATLECRVGRSPKEEEIAQQLGMTLAEFREWHQRAQIYTFVSTVGESDEEDCDLLNLVADESALDPAAALERQDLVERIHEAIEQLPSKLKQVMALYYHEELQMQEIARVLDVTESRVSQMHSQAIQLVKRHLSSCASREGLVSKS